MEKHQPRAPPPERAQKGHPVPDLDEPVEAPDRPEATAGDLSRCLCEDPVPAGTPHDAIAVSAVLAPCSRHGARPHEDVDAGGSPAAGDLVSMQLRAPGFRVVEIPPGHHGDAAETRLRREGGESLRPSRKRTRTPRPMTPRGEERSRTGREQGSRATGTRGSERIGAEIPRSRPLGEPFRPAPRDTPPRRSPSRCRRSRRRGSRR